AELLDQLLRRFEQIGVVVPAFRGRITNEETTCLMAQPADDGLVTRQLDDVPQAVERVPGAAGVSIIRAGFFAPLIDQRRRNVQPSRDRLHADLVDGFAQDFMRFHWATSVRLLASKCKARTRRARAVTAQGSIIIENFSCECGLLYCAEVRCR